MPDLLPLAIHGAARPGDLEALVVAKRSLGLAYLITPVVAHPGSPTRVLALREAPPFLCDWRGSMDPQNDPELAAKMAWVLDDTIDDPQANLIIEQLQAIFGPDLKEIPYVPEEPDIDLILHPAPRRRHNPND